MKPALETREMVAKRVSYSPDSLRFRILFWFRNGIGRALYFAKMIGWKRYSQYFLRILWFCFHRHPKRYTLGVCTIMMNETPYVHEWIEFHKVVGVEHFWIYDNDSTDNLRDVLAPYIQSGEVTYIPFPGHSQQMAVYQHMLSRAYRYTKWLAILDCDEFLTPIKHDTIPEYLHSLSQKLGTDPDNIVVNWLMHGHNRHRDKPEGLVTENYPKCQFDAPMNRHVKSIVRTDRALSCYSPHFFLFAPFARYVRTNGQVPDLFFDSEPLFDELVVHHFFTRSYEEWIAKTHRRDVFYNTPKWKPTPYNPDFLSIHEDHSLERFLPELKRRLSLPS